MDDWRFRVGTLCKPGDNLEVETKGEEDAIGGKAEFERLITDFADNND